MVSAFFNKNFSKEEEESDFVSVGDLNKSDLGAEKDHLCQGDELVLTINEYALSRRLCRDLALRLC